MKYYITYRIDARYIAEVEANSLEEALEKADSEFCDADFGVAEEIVGEEVIIVEDETGHFVYER